MRFTRITYDCDFWSELELYDIIILLNCILINDITWAIEAIVIFYYVLFMIYRYNTSIIYCTLMLLQFTIIYGIINVLMPRLIKRVIPSYIWIIIVCSFILSGFAILCSMQFNILENYWYYNVFAGLLFGIISILSEMCILELQPTKHIGKITGIKGLAKYFLRSITILLIGLFWTGPYYKALWYGISILSFVQCLKN